MQSHFFVPAQTKYAFHNRTGGVSMIKFGNFAPHILAEQRNNSAAPSPSPGLKTLPVRNRPSETKRCILIGRQSVGCISNYRL